MRFVTFLLLSCLCLPCAYAVDNVRLKELGKIEGWRENHLVGMGIVTGLAGTGDSSRSKVTAQTVANFLSNYGVVVTPDQVNSRNVAIVSLMAVLPPVTHRGDKLDVTVTSMGDARSLLGGTLILAPLKGPNGKIYALAQGAISIGGYKFDQFGNVSQKNHPTAGVISGGAQAEEDVLALPLRDDGSVDYILNSPDYTTIKRVSLAINKKLKGNYAKVKDSSAVRVALPSVFKDDVSDFISALESVEVLPDVKAKVVINEKTGTIVTGGDVKLSKTTVAHGDLKVAIRNTFSVSQPLVIGRAGPNIRTQLVPNTRIDVNESNTNMIELPESSTVSDLLKALKKIKASTRDTISILQGIKAAGALHADLILQ